MLSLLDRMVSRMPKMRCKVGIVSPIGDELYVPMIPMLVCY